MHDNKVYKILRIVFLTLAILSLVFTLAKKVGLCASDSSSLGVTSYPLPFGLSTGYGVSSDAASVLSQLDFDSMLADCKAQRGDDVDTVVIVEYGNSDYFILGFCDSEWLITVDSLTLSSNSVVSWGSGSHQITAGRRYSNGYWSDYWFANLWGTNCAIGSHLTALPSGGYSLNSDEFISCYPIYSTAENIYDSSGNLIYTQNFGGGGDSLADPDLDWGAIDQILNTTQLISDTVDNSWTNFTFWQKLLNILVQGFNNFVHTGQWLLNNLLSFFKPVFDSILNVLQWIVSFYKNLFSSLTTFFGSILDFVENGFQSVLTAINTFKNSVLDAFSSITSSISGFFSGLYNNISGFFGHLHEIYEWFYNHGLDSDHEFDFMVLYHYLFDFDSSAALTAFQNNKYGDFILDVRDFGSTLFTSITGATASERVFFTISLGDHFGTHFQDITIDFDWYASIRDTFLPYLMAFVYVSAIWLFIKRLPDIIHGAASAESSFRDELSGQEFAPTSHGIFTRGVSKNQPSLDKSPLSGGGGVHSGSSQFWY